MSTVPIINLGRLLLASPGVALRSGSGRAGTGGEGAGSGVSSITLLAGPGQSNAGYAETQDGALAALAQGVSFYLQVSATPAVLSSWVNPGETGTEMSGVGVMEISTSSLFGQSFLSNDAGTDFTAVTAADAGLGLCGRGYAAYIQALSAEQVAGVDALISYWGETDSLEYGPAEKAVYKAALINILGRVRAMLAKSAAEMPMIFFAPPYGLLPNYITYPPTLREVWAELDGDAALNFHWAVRQTYDTISRNEVWDPVTGVASGGNTDGGHRSAADNMALFRRAALPTARAILASKGLSSSAIPASLGTGLGPQIVGAALAGTTLTLTVEHDGGDDLIVPLLAKQGVGFSVMDGGSVSEPGAIIQAVSCARIDPTHLQLTLSSAPTNPHSACRLLYPWAGEFWAAQPDTEIGRGCAVTDNFALVPKPAGFDVSSSLGGGWGANLPLQTPVTVNAGVAAYGIPLSS